MSTASPTIEDINELVAQAAIAADSAMGTETEAFYVAEHLAITDWFVVTTGRNPRAVRALVEKVEEALTIKYSVKPITIEGKEAGEWILMDYGDFVVHVFGSEARNYYDLGRLWQDVPRMKIEFEQRGDTEEPIAG